MSVRLARFMEITQIAAAAGHRTFAGCQDSPDQQHLRVLPAALEKQRRKAQDHRGEAGWQVKHGSVSWRGHASLVNHPPRRLRLPQMAKVELIWRRDQAQNRLSFTIHNVIIGVSGDVWT